MLKAMIKILRPRQWIKNIFVFAAVVFDEKLLEPDAFLRTLLGALLFCAISSGVYIFNDLIDLEADRKHPLKKDRPLASGELPLSVALLVGILLTGIALGFGYLLSPSFTLILLVYLLLILAYSKWLKHVPILDVLVIAAAFVLRVHSGTTLIEVERFSPWMYVIMSLLALYLGFGKRRAELTLLATNSEHPRNFRQVLEGYSIPLLDQYITIVSGMTIIAYSLYTFSAPKMQENYAMILTIPIVVYCIFRYLYLIQIKNHGGAPEDVVLTDRPFQIGIILWGLVVLAIFYLP